MQNKRRDDKIKDRTGLWFGDYVKSVEVIWRGVVKMPSVVPI